jgi:transposase
METEVGHGETRSTREFKLEAMKLITDRGVSYVQAAQELGVHQSVLRTCVRAFADDPQHAFPGQGQMKPEQLKIARLKREVIKLKAQRDIQKNGGLLREGVKFDFTAKHSDLAAAERPAACGAPPSWYDFLL